MKNFIFAMLPLLAGCLATAPNAPTCWTVDGIHSQQQPTEAAVTADAVRILRVDVCAPYNGTRMVVLRQDGSVAFDAFNAFAVSPASLLKGAAQNAVTQYGRFKRVLPAASSARARYALEFDVNVLALDCRFGKPNVRVELTATLLDGREIVGMATGESSGRKDHTDGETDGSWDGNYSVAFSTAFFRAVGDALGKLPVK